MFVLNKLLFISVIRIPFFCVEPMEEELKTPQWSFLPIQWPEQWELQTSLQWQAEHTSLQRGTTE